MNAALTAIVGESPRLTPGAATRGPTGAAARATPSAAERDRALQSHALHLLERLRVEITSGRMPVPVTAAVAAALRHGLAWSAACDSQAYSGNPTRRVDLSGAARGLSAAEKDVLSLIEQGRSAKQIASARNASVNTVRSQIASILRKTGCQSQRELLVQLRLAAAADGRGHLEHRAGHPPRGLDGADDQTSAGQIGPRHWTPDAFPRAAPYGRI